MKQLVQNLLGTYTPITTGGDIGTIDFAYIFGGIIFCICLYFTFKIIIKCLFYD